ncbi:RNA polymerase sigma factor [Chondromyces crocatus]|uniref:ECF family RNA polymerase sigma factor n=1 Tax=Chondromyces crocatus TaxID=52 RepID=A0A0K1E7D2_CHOCO|nr:RNA polymerase sigma factor [Chondromyces crocatus]AKT36769.1 ECF family RNA polymerase sigma factor [Chondromyces crocatus]
MLGVTEPDFDEVLQEVLLATFTALQRFDIHRGARLAGPDVEPEPPSGAPALARLRQGTSWGPLQGWLFGIAWRQVSHYRERAHRRREVMVGLLRKDEGNAALAWNPEEELGRRESLVRFGAVLERLDLHRRAVLVLHDLLDFSIAEIAEELGLNRNTTQNRLRVARGEFEAALRRLNDEEWQALALSGVPMRRGQAPRRRRRKGSS